MKERTKRIWMTICSVLICGFSVGMFNFSALIISEKKKWKCLWLAPRDQEQNLRLMRMFLMRRMTNYEVVYTVE
ncbi:MAG: hypothetical protein NC302_05980 [Bacteroidales bacterium]|nr:hypothetical protein [Bacteroidales bacterium]MCM1416837.1 hypothetical protein [bacterium]MCM1423988.1 hypothetical protein [bacterium]